MKLAKVSIQNYRSISSLTLGFPFGCQALIGMNESGKSNILRALALIDPSTTVAPTDLRIERRGESEVKEGEVEFVFDLDESEIAELVKAVQERFDPASLDLPFATFEGRELTISQFCAMRKQGIYDVKIPDGKRSTNFYTLPPGFEVLPGWAFNPTEVAYTVAGADGQADVIVPARGYAKLDAALIGKPLEHATAVAVNFLVGLRTKKLVTERLPKCIFWRYSEQYLLPSVLSVDAFAANPDTCVPLRSMFELAGYRGADIGASLQKAKAGMPHRYIQLLRNVQEAATNHIREVWHDHKNVQIELQPNGDTLHPLISDATVPLDMANRSDGFKRFVSFLLQISAKVRSDEMKDVLLLIDEPEIALNPGGARSLLQELIQVGETNTVVYSTHSIFMIDRNQVDRHIVLERKNEVTSAKRAERSKIQDDQVLYAALGYSLFEVLKQKNLIFEGWKDKEVFRVAADSIARADKEAKASLAQIGLTYAEGVKDVKHISSFLELADRSCLIISDADKPALEKKKQYEKVGAWGTWKTLREILGAGSLAITGEDLITKAAILKRANKWRSTVPALAALTEESLVGKPTLTALDEWLNTVGLESDVRDEALGNLKTALFDALKRDELTEDAAKLVQYVLDYDFRAK